MTPLPVDLGVSCVRDGTDIDPAHYRSLYEDHGIRVILITDYRTMDGAAVRDYVKVGPEAVIALENDDEPRGFIGGDWAPQVRDHQIDLWTSIKGDPATAGVRVATSSPLGGDDVEAVGDVSEYADWGTVHNYYGGRHPETGGWSDDGYGSLSWARRTLVEPTVGDRLQRRAGHAVRAQCCLGARSRHLHPPVVPLPLRERRAAQRLLRVLAPGDEPGGARGGLRRGPQRLLAEAAYTSMRNRIALCRPEQSADCSALPAGSTVDVDVPDDVVLLRVG